MLLWMMSSPFEGILGVKTADRPMKGHVSHGQALIKSRVFKSR